MRSTQSTFTGRARQPGQSYDAWETRLRATRAIQAAATELKDLVRHARNAGVPVECKIDGREINIADLVITINMRAQLLGPRPPPEND